MCTSPPACRKQSRPLAVIETTSKKNMMNGKNFSFENMAVMVGKYSHLV